MGKQMSQGQSELILDEGWMIVRADDDLPLDFPVPGDVHSVLLPTSSSPIPIGAMSRRVLTGCMKASGLPRQASASKTCPKGASCSVLMASTAMQT